MSMNLAKQLLNNPRLIALTVAAERDEIKTVLNATHNVTLKRTFNQKWPDGSITKFWRVTGPVNHRNYGSDLSLDGLKEWRII